MQVKFLDLQSINQSYEPELTAAAMQTIKSGWYLHGSQTEAFEAEWGAYCDAPYAIGVGNGLDGLRIVLQAWKTMYGWKDGDEVIVPANTFIATPLAVSQVGLRPVFCDVNRHDALIRTDAEYLQSLLTENTRCIIPVHLYGQTANLTAIYDFAQRHKLKVLEDACQAHGAKTSYSGVRTCVYSFYPGKNLGALGDGGCITTHCAELANLSRKIANYGQTVKYLHEYQGVNSRLDEIQAAILRIKLKRLDTDNKRRIEIAAYYANELSNTQQLNTTTDGTHVYHIYPYITDSRADLQQHLTSKGIQTQIHYPHPCHKQKAYSHYNNVLLPNAEYLSAHELSLPISPILKNEEAEYVASEIKNFMQSFI